MKEILRSEFFTDHLLVQSRCGCLRAKLHTAHGITFEKCRSYPPRPLLTSTENIPVDEGYADDYPPISGIEIFDYQKSGLKHPWSYAYRNRKAHDA
jgi:hypothetical protein